MRVFAALRGRSAEDAVRRAASLPSSVGVALGADLVVGLGAPVASALTADREVLVSAPLLDEPEGTADAVMRLAGFGVSWVALSPLGGGAVEAGVEAAHRSGCRAALVAAGASLDDAATHALLGMSSGKLASRVAQRAVAAAADGVLCRFPELGVVRQVATDLAPLTLVSAAGELAAAGERGAHAVIVPLPGEGSWMTDDLLASPG